MPDPTEAVEGEGQRKERLDAHLHEHGPAGERGGDAGGFEVPA